jgi:vacuolar-type H+-ATPase subunit H
MADILALVDRLEAVVNQGWRIPFTTKTAIHENEFFEIIDQMRVSIPEEIRRAEALLQAKENVMAEAAADAERLVEDTRRKAERLLDEHEIAAAARSEAESIRAQAQRDAEEVRKGADDYVVGALSDLESRLSSLLRTTSNGLSKLQRKYGPKPGDDSPDTTQSS